MQKIIKTSHTGKGWIQESTHKGVTSVNICSAYIRSDTFSYFFEEIFNKGTRIRVLARWGLSDLIAQSSDLKTYMVCKENNIDFYIKQDFHGKVYGLAPHGVLLGSFNLTDRGFSIYNSGNDEAGVLIENDQDSEDYFNQLFISAKKVDDDLYKKISSFIEENTEDNSSSITWPDEIANLIKPRLIQFTEKILVNECMSTTFNEFMTDRSNARQHDLSLLAISVQHANDLSIIREKFIKTKLSKLVVFDKNIDNILGYVHQRALFQNPENLTSILLPIPAVPESMNASDLISKFTRERKSIAWVVDEFGGTSGIITFEDLLEELFGDIQDEYDVD
jgi:hypothetical protein